MESVPVAFLTGANSSMRSVSTTIERSAIGIASNTNFSSFTALFVSGTIWCPVSGSK